MDPVGPMKTQMGLDGKTWEPDACRQDPVLYSVPCLVILLVFVATVINMEARKDLNMKPQAKSLQSNHHTPLPPKQF